MPPKLQRSSKKTTSSIVAPNPASFLDCFLVVHALKAVCLHPALEATKKSPVGRQNLPPAPAGTKLQLHWYCGTPLILTSVAPGTKVVDPSDPDCPVVQPSKFGGDYQTRFRPGRGSEYVRVAIGDDLKNTVDHNGVTALLLLDLSAVFDTVDHDTLKQKLYEAGIEGTLD
ncbi:hypothetical protein NDU88_000561 [Pleurodeles waltl]|uniref:Reverse transcriptase domain-containing protein n=1 Tax=Pleurodeles waltl TaxID=8319 RepID=A0AAV7TFU1_PLEWA|nr:hypothetical protein NDU88_000561 [Pleurodeles waltl]